MTRRPHYELAPKLLFDPEKPSGLKAVCLTLANNSLRRTRREQTPNRQTAEALQSLQAPWSQACEALLGKINIMTLGEGRPRYSFNDQQDRMHGSQWQRTTNETTVADQNTPVYLELGVQLGAEILFAPEAYTDETVETSPSHSIQTVTIGDFGSADRPANPKKYIAIMNPELPPTGGQEFNKFMVEHDYIYGTPLGHLSPKAAYHQRGLMREIAKIADNMNPVIVSKY